MKTHSHINSVETNLGLLDLTSCVLHQCLAERGVTSLLEDSELLSGRLGNTFEALLRCQCIASERYGVISMKYKSMSHHSLKYQW